MTAVPEHLLDRAKAAREAAGGTQAGPSSGRSGAIPFPTRGIGSSRLGSESPFGGVLGGFGGSRPEDAAAREVADRLAGDAVAAPEALIGKIEKALGEMVDGVFLDFKVAREDGKTAIHLVIDDRVLSNAIVSFLKKL